MEVIDLLNKTIKVTDLKAAIEQAKIDQAIMEQEEAERQRILAEEKAAEELRLKQTIVETDLKTKEVKIINVHK